MKLSHHVTALLPFLLSAAAAWPANLKAVPMNESETVLYQGAFPFLTDSDLIGTSNLEIDSVFPITFLPFDSWMTMSAFPSDLIFNFDDFPKSDFLVLVKTNCELSDGVSPSDLVDVQMDNNTLIIRSTDDTLPWVSEWDASYDSFLPTSMYEGTWDCPAIKQGGAGLTSSPVAAPTGTSSPVAAPTGTSSPVAAPTGSETTVSPTSAPVAPPTKQSVAPPSLGTSANQESVNPVDGVDSSTSEATSDGGRYRLSLPLLWTSYALLAAADAIPTKAALIPMSTMLLYSATTSASTTSGMKHEAPTRVTSLRRHAEEQCQTSVEIIWMDRCMDVPKVTAPVFRDYPVNVNVNDTIHDSDNDTCTATYEVMDMGANSTYLYQNGSSFFGGLCAVEGRPFNDRHGKTHMAPVIESGTPSAWSVCAESEKLNSPVQDFTRMMGLVEEWKSRAAGEHSSIASFSAFTIALLSNQAPPDLIQGSLQAAMEELQHAQTSYEMATMLIQKLEQHGNEGQNLVFLEPGPLPATQLEFGNDLTALALGVAKEGCIDETLSALGLLAPLMENDKNDEAIGDIIRLLDSKTEQIAKEEGTHASLAWRTIHWVCQKDPEGACATVQKQVLNPSNLQIQVQLRFGEQGEIAARIHKAWNYLYGALLPIATSEDSVADPRLSMKEPNLKGKTNNVFMLAQDIVMDVAEKLGAASSSATA